MSQNLQKVLNRYTPSLNPSEERFVHDLKEFCVGNQDVLAGKELFLLRNLSRGKGIVK